MDHLFVLLKMENQLVLLWVLLLEGLVMGTRSGDIDAGVIPYLMEKKV